MVTAGSHDVMLMRVVDLGTQPGSGKYPAPKRKLQLTYEVLDQTVDIGGQQKPMWIYDNIAPVYVSESKQTNYHKLLNTLFGRELSFDEAKVAKFEDILGTIYTANIVHNWQWENIGSIAKASKVSQEHYKNYQSPNEMFVFSLDEFDKEVFEKIWEKTRSKIMESPEYESIFDKEIENMSNNDLPADDLPF